MQIIKTICPKCFKIFNVSEKINHVKCNFCDFIYALPKLVPNVNLKTGKMDFFSENYYNY